MRDDSDVADALPYYTVMPHGIMFHSDKLGHSEPNYVDNSQASLAQCECGAKFVHWATDSHSSWCPVAIFGLTKESKW